MVGGPQAEVGASAGGQPLAEPRLLDAGRELEVDAAYPRFVVVVHDPLSGEPGYRSIAAFAVSTMLRHIGVDTRWTDATEPAEVLQGVAGHRPSCAVLVLSAPAAHADPAGCVARMWDRPAALARAYRRAGVPVVAVRLGGSAAALAACVDAGATGVPDLENLREELCRLAGSLASGWSWPDPVGGSPRHGEADKQARNSDRDVLFAAFSRLTPAERRVLALLAEGWSAHEIAEQSVLSLSTVRSHIRSILRELGVSSQLAAVAIVHGAVPQAHRG